MALTAGKQGGVNAALAAVPFREIWLVDFEFQPDANLHPRPICMVAIECRTGARLRLWESELRAIKHAPFDTGEDALMIAYLASAELGCFLALGWPLPINILDLYVEHRVATNGLRLTQKNSLLGALALRGLAHIDAGEKEEMRQLILGQSSWSVEEQLSIFTYCKSDVIALRTLLTVMAPSIDWRRAVQLRGRYMAATPEWWTGTPLIVMLTGANEQWDSLKLNPLPMLIGITVYTTGRH